MEVSELEEVNALVGQVIQGRKGSKKGSFGNYEYSYKAKQNNRFRYSAIDQSEYKEMSIEFVIEPKSNRQAYRKGKGFKTFPFILEQSNNHL